MKKLIALILAALLIPAASLAAVPDISALPEAELLELNRQIQLRLFSQQLVDGVTVPDGVYTVGEDIPAGTYRIVYNQGGEFDFCSFLAINEAALDSFMTILGYGGSSEIGKLALSEGTVITLERGSVIFYAYSGLFN